MIQVPVPAIFNMSIKKERGKRKSEKHENPWEAKGNYSNAS